MSLSRIHRERSLGYLPGFVDIFSTLILGIIFLLTMFVIVQFFLQKEESNYTALQILNERTAQSVEKCHYRPKCIAAKFSDSLQALGVTPDKPPRRYVWNYPSSVAPEKIDRASP
jgi:hypothetical protein